MLWSAQNVNPNLGKLFKETVERGAYNRTNPSAMHLHRLAADVWMPMFDCSKVSSQTLTADVPMFERYATCLNIGTQTSVADGRFFPKDGLPPLQDGTYKDAIYEPPLRRGSNSKQHSELFGTFFFEVGSFIKSFHYHIKQLLMKRLSKTSSSSSSVTKQE